LAVGGGKTTNALGVGKKRPIRPPPTKRGEAHPHSQEKKREIEPKKKRIFRLREERRRRGREDSSQKKEESHRNKGWGRKKISTLKREEGSAVGGK